MAQLEVKTKGVQNRKQTDFGSMSKEQLIEVSTAYEQENSRLKNRLAQYEPFKQRELRGPNAGKLSKLFEKFQVRKYALKVCYLGFNYDGMSCQSLNDNTVEEYIFKAMYALSLTATTLPEEGFTRAGRTDKGVSAMGNVIALPLRTDIERNLQSKETQDATSGLDYCKMLNAILPEDIRMLACEPVSQDFNARYWCTRRSYKYFFARANLNMEAMRGCIGEFKGKHNFINYCKMNVTNTVNFERTIMEAEICSVSANIPPLQQGDSRNQIYYLHFVGNSFLWHQIRFMASILFLVGTGKEAPSIVRDLLDVQKYPRKPNYVMAPDYPLILEDCQYDQIVFKPALQTTVDFYNTFNEIVMRKSVESVLLANCMLLARESLLLSAQITSEVFLAASFERGKTQNGNYKCLVMHKASSRGLDEAIKSLKGKKLELYNKKAERQAAYEERARQANDSKR